MAQLLDTIAALCTPSGRGGVGVIRVSGPESATVAQKILGQLPPQRIATYLPFKDVEGETMDVGIALYFKAPHSFTGEDVLELQGHGGPVVMDMILQALYAQGVRPARPGEFSERAFLNDKMDLAQAEAIADLIDSGSQAAARSALRSMQGEFSSQIRQLVKAVTELRMYVESAIDFVDEEIDFLSEGNVEERLQTLIVDLNDILDHARQGYLLREGMTVVIAGQPNVGKSSLLNYLARRESAIVTDIPGTTRDVLREEIILDGLPLHVIDTAGLHDSDDVVEQMGIDRAWTEIAQADLILLVVKDSDEPLSGLDDIIGELPVDARITIVRNKIDLTQRSPTITTGDLGEEVLVSVNKDLGMDLLIEHLKSVVGFNSADSGTFMARRRHIESLVQAQTLLETGSVQFQAHQAGELLAEDLRQTQQALSDVTGEFTSDDLLGEIFSNFCIGK